jgi:hypothetical protein
MRHVLGGEGDKEHAAQQGRTERVFEQPEALGRFDAVV